MSTPVQPTPAPNVELELAKLANEAMAQGADPHDVTGKLHQTISYLRQFPQMAEHATNALADGVASPADISRTLWPHISAMQHANGAPGVSNAPTDQEAANLPPDNTVRSRIGGGLAAFESGIPGGEALTTGLHALTSGQPYRTAYKDVQAAENSSPIKTPLRIAGSVAAMRATPGSPGLSAAREGLAEGVLNANPDQPLDQRLKSGAETAAINGVAGTVADKALTGARAFIAKSPAANIVARNGAMRAADATNYGAAASEGQAAVQASHPALPQLSQTLDDPDIKPYAEMIRSSRKFAGADEPTVAQETYKLMTKQQGGLARRLADQGFDAATQLQHDNIGLAKDQLMTSAKQVMPSFENAVGQHAEAAGLRDMVQKGAAVGQKLVSNSKAVGGIATKSPEAFQVSIPRLSQDKAAAATEGVLGQAGKSTGLTFNPKTFFGVGPSLAATRVSPVVNQLDQQAGRRLPSLTRQAGIGSTDALLHALGIDGPDQQP